MRAVESNAPEGRVAQAPGIRGGCVYGLGRNARIAARPRIRGGPERQAGAPSRPGIPSIPLRSAALELSASCVREGFPPAPRRGSV